jgi:hypothetical protein
MLEYGVGKNFAKTYSKIADYYENSLLDFRKADKVYRIGQVKLKELSEQSDNSSKIDREIATLDSLYLLFSDRILRRAEDEALNHL